MNHQNPQPTHRPPQGSGASAAAPRGAVGMTVIELLVVLTIVAGLVGGGVYMMSILTHSNLKDESMRFTSVVQHTSAQAALNNRQYRLVIDLDNHEYYTEVTDAELIIDPSGDEMDTAYDEGLLPEEVRQMEAESEYGDNDMYREESHDPFGVTRRTGFQSADDRLVEPRSLDHGIEFERVLTEIRDRPVRRGRVAIHFFPNGVQQQAYVVLRDPTGRKFTLITEPLTGRVQIHSGEEEVPDDFGREEVDEGF